MTAGLFSSALDTAAAIRAKEVSPLEVLEATLNAVDRLDPALNALVWRNDEVVREEARALGERIAVGTGELPPFAGVPLPIKDLTPVAGQPATYGSFGAPEAVSAADELVVAAFRRAGFLLTGRTNTPEFGSITVTENLRYGPTRNPWDHGRTPGGSSGGAAAAVASGMFTAAHGNDGGGSIRIPASCCGLVGLKPGRGRVPSTVPAWQGMAVEGALCRTVADAAALFDVVSGPDRNGWWPAPAVPVVTGSAAAPGRLRVVLNTVSSLGIPVDPVVVAAVEETGRLLESVGHRVERLEADLLDPEGFGPFLNVVHSGLAEYEGIDWERVEPHNRASYDAARAVDSATFVRSLNELERLSRTLVGRFGTEFDLYVSPTMAIEPPPVGLLEAVHASPEVPPLEVLGMAAFTALFNITGQPAISVPVAVAPSGLPVGVQLVAGPWEEPLLLAVAAQLEELIGWGDRRPS